MIEAAVSFGIALCAAAAAVANRLHSRVTEPDKRVDKAELLMAQTYVNKQEYFQALDKIEAHMVRIEEEIDKIITS